MHVPGMIHLLPAAATSIEPPLQFTYPFCYEPHPLCRMAAEAVKAELRAHADWQAEVDEGKMLGVLVVGDRTASPLAPRSAIGFLAAFSGTLCGRGTLPYFVPPVFDLHGTYFEEEEARISAMPLGEERKHRSQELQTWLFRQFNFLNAEGQTASLPDIFGEKVPPSGSGECCAPKLLQYAYLHHLQPLCMGEFWMGASPRGEIREEGHFYHACQHKCKPILTWMLRGLDVEENPMMHDYGHLVAQLRIIHEDTDIVVVEKPSGLLAVPGKDDLPTVQDIVQATPAHRLDMDTSGLMVLARNEEAYRRLQEQFVRHVVGKRYSALLERPMPEGEEGRIDLPLCPNPYDRPRQMVHEQYGRRSITNFRVVGNPGGHALMHLWPETGRTHQLRVHMAHPEGLGNPILGDRLYGHAGRRLMLQADELSFTHPATGERLTFRLPPLELRT